MESESQWYASLSLGFVIIHRAKNNTNYLVAMTTAFTGLYISKVAPCAIWQRAGVEKSENGKASNLK